MYVSVQTFGRIGQLANSKLTWLLTLLHVAFVAQDKRYSIRLKKNPATIPSKTRGSMKQSQRNNVFKKQLA